MIICYYDTITDHYISIHLPSIARIGERLRIRHFNRVERLQLPHHSAHMERAACALLYGPHATHFQFKVLEREGVSYHIYRHVHLNAGSGDHTHTHKYMHVDQLNKSRSEMVLSHIHT